MHCPAWFASWRGVLSLRLSAPGSWRFQTLVGSLVGLLLFMAAAVILDWPDLETATRVVFVALFGLGTYMMWRVIHAATLLVRHSDDWRPRYLDDIGFILIALFAGLVIIAALDLGAPAWAVALIAVAGVVAGHLTMQRVKARLGVGPATS